MISFKIFATNLILVIPLLFASVAVVNAQTDTTDKIFGACAQAPDSPACKSKNTTENPVVRIINVAANIIALLTGIGAVIMIILGGFSYITAAGNAERATNARRRIIYSIVGLVVVALAWAATRFITDRVIQ
ncbi:MAG TPA: pilin [Candidatus Saccharimonadales bacterium]|nr:pilin [Candidatus Saccharimonadales bacterium]